MVGSGIAANLGILIKGGKVLEKASKITAVVFDKTGTLTEGIPEVTNIETSCKNYSEKDIHFLTSICESESEHPLGRVITNEFSDKLSQSEFEQLSAKYSLLEFENFNGEGIVCKVKCNIKSKGQKDEIQVMIGNEKLMKRFEATLDHDIYEKLTVLEQQGKTVVQMAINNEVVSIIALEEKHLCKPESKEVINYLKSHGYEIHIITGDHKFAALKVASFLGIDHHNVLYRAYPEDKKKKVEYLQKKGHVVMFIGDGVNDSPVLAQSDVGVAINTQSDITVGAADVVIIKDDLTSVIDTIRLTKSAFRRIKINFFWAFIYNVILIPIAMGVLYPIVGFRMSPHIAALAMALSSISVVLSSLMLKLYRPYSRA